MQYFTKGPSYREQNNLNWKRVRNLCTKAVNKYKIFRGKSTAKMYCGALQDGTLSGIA